MMLTVGVKTYSVYMSTFAGKLPHVKRIQKAFEVGYRVFDPHTVPLAYFPLGDIGCLGSIQTSWFNSFQNYYLVNWIYHSQLGANHKSSYETTNRQALENPTKCWETSKTTTTPYKSQ